MRNETESRSGNQKFFSAAGVRADDGEQVRHGEGEGVEQL